MKIISFLISFLMFIPLAIIAQCTGFPAALPDADCSLLTPLSNNENINTGQVFGVCGNFGTNPTFSGINLNGGLIRVCSNTSISGNFNSGTIVVACGSTLNFPSGLLLNQNVGIINYGTVIVSGNMLLQNTNIFFYNESSTSRLYVSGNLSFPQNNGQNAYLKNNGYISVTNNFNALDGGFTCLGSNSKFVCNNINYIQNCGGPNNRFTYSGGVDSSIIRYSGSAIIKANFTTSAYINVYRAPGANALNNAGCVGGSFGSATVTNNAPSIANPSEPDPATCAIQNCYTIILPIKLINFSSRTDNNIIKLSWTTASEVNNDYFTLERSNNGINWKKINKIKGAGNSNTLLYYHFTDYKPFITTNYYRLKQTDFNGDFSYSNIIASETLKNTEISIHPNPAINNLHLTSSESELEEINLFNFLGKNLTHLMEINIISKTSKSINVEKLATGSYLLKTKTQAVVVYIK